MLLSQRSSPALLSHLPKPGVPRPVAEMDAAPAKPLHGSSDEKDAGASQQLGGLPPVQAPTTLPQSLRDSIALNIATQGAFFGKDSIREWRAWADHQEAVLEEFLRRRNLEVRKRSTIQVWNLRIVCHNRRLKNAIARLSARSVCIAFTRWVWCTSATKQARRSSRRIELRWQRMRIAQVMANWADERKQAQRMRHVLAKVVARWQQTFLAPAFASWAEKDIPDATCVENPHINEADQWREMVLPAVSALGQSLAEGPEQPPPDDPVWDDEALAGLRRVAGATRIYRIVVCITLYNEPGCEVAATLKAINDSIACLRKAARRYHEQREYEVVVVLIQDGCVHPTNGKAIVHPTTRELLELDGTLPSVWTPGTDHSRLTAIISPGVATARAQLAKKVAGFDGEYSVAASSASAAGDAKAGSVDAVGACPEAGQAWARKYKELDMALIVSKGPNRRKYNSHGWFYGACEGLLKPDFVFLTDAGTTYKRDCLRKLVEALHENRDLVGTTGRQRAMTPGSMPGYDSSCGSWMRWLASPAMLQAFEFEATFILNTALFSMLGMLPVLPGPCQLLRWEAVRSAFKEYLKIVRPTAGDGFIKALLRLAEDRVLSALVVLRSGGRTIWVPGATFYYPPEMSLESLIAQRRRWINGTLGAFLYVISDPDGVVDDGQLPAPANPRVLAACWFFQMYQSTTVALSPAIFADALQSSVLELEQKEWAGGFLSQARYHKFLGAPEMVAGGFFLVYLIWMLGAHFHKLSGCFCAGVWARLVFLINAFTMFTIMYSMVCVLC